VLHLAEPLLVTEYIFCETINHLSRRADRHRAATIIRLVFENPSYTFIHAASELFESGLQLHRDRPDKEWSLTDCISFHLMQARGVTCALAYDLHFEQAGFEALLRHDPTA
jgi:predicted nucleic acid-binding protein